MNFKKQSRLNGADSRGFTIMELLVASAVTMIIALIMISLISSILTGWTRTSGALTTESQARLVLDVITEDLQSAYFENNGNVWLAATILHGADATEPERGWYDDDIRNPQAQKPIQEGNTNYLFLLPEYEGADLPANPLLNPPNQAFDAETMPWRYGTGGTWLRFFTSAADPSGAQMPRAVAYQIVRRPITAADDAEVRYMLYRSSVDAQNTLEIGYHFGTFATSASSALNTIYAVNPDSPYYDAGSLASPAGDPAPGAPETIRRPHPSSVIASNVIDFGVRFYERDANGQLVLRFPEHASPVRSTGGVASQSGRHYFAGEIDNSGRILAPFPDVIDIFIRILTPEGAKLIQNLENSPPGATQAQTWWEIAEEHSQVFSRRIQLRR